ncbi:MAG: hypothetical protein Q8838_02725, partial [Candidatus Phytoplasma australasiaticum]|nr:hypothetical protein [Candidatus Phytoplasma australasiaticum]
KALSNARKNLKNYPVQFFVSDGFKNIYSDFDLAVICGLGAYILMLSVENWCNWMCNIRG